MARPIRIEMKVAQMWLLLFVLSCCIVTLIFGLMRASKRADEAEERILEILLDNLPTYIS